MKDTCLGRISIESGSVEGSLAPPVRRSAFHPRVAAWGLVFALIAGTMIPAAAVPVVAAPPEISTESGLGESLVIEDVFVFYIYDTTYLVVGNVSSSVSPEGTAVVFGGVLNGYTAYADASGNFAFLAEYPQEGIATAQAFNGDLESQVIMVYVGGY